MMQMDQLAHQSALGHVKASTKVIVALVLLALTLILNNPFSSFIVLVGMSLLIVQRAKVAPALWQKILLAESTFILLSILMIVVTITTDPPTAGGYGGMIGRFWIGTELDNLKTAVNLLLRTLGSISCLNFVALTTPLHDLIKLMNRWKVPTVLTDLMFLTYRFLWSLLVSLEQMRTAQASRLGYSSWGNSLRSASTLATRLFLRAYGRATQLEDSYQSRLGDSSMPIWMHHHHEEANWLFRFGGVLAGLMLIVKLFI